MLRFTKDRAAAPAQRGTSRAASRRDFARRAACAALVFAVAACASVPKQNLERYVSDFNTAKGTAQDIYLAAQVQVERSDDGSSRGRAERVQRIAAVQARLAALELIDRYNSALVKLASGADPAGVREDLEGLSGGLKSFGVDRLTALGASVAPYLGILSQAIAAIDGAIKAQRFADAAAAGEKPVLEIIGILRQDADNLRQIQSRPMEMSSNLDLDKAITLRFRIQALANDLKADPDVTAAISSFNRSAASLDTEPANKPAPVLYAPTGAARSAGPEDLALLQSLLNQGEALVADFNQARSRIKAQQKLVEEYGKLLDACAGALQELNAAVRDGRRAATLALAVNVMNLRKAYLEVREAR